MTYKKIYSLMNHERMRWQQMNYRRLLTRLSKITKEEKLYCFLILATETGDQKLFNAGIVRAGELGYNMDIEKVKKIANETKIFKIDMPGYKKAIDGFIDKQVEKIITNAPKYVAPEEKKYRKPEDRYLNMFTKDELTRSIEF